MRQFVLLLALCACSEGPGGVRGNVFQPDVVCPGAKCPATNDGLFVGYAQAVISPTLPANGGDFSDWHDDNCNDTWQLGETSNVRPNGVFLFGRDSGRPALGIRDDLQARTIVIKTHGLTVALTELDLGGYFLEQIDDIRAKVAAMGDKVDLILVGSTHNHEAPDTVGLWGRDDQHSGVDTAWEDFIDAQAATTIHQALASLEPAMLTIGQALTQDGNDMSHYIGDSRDPVVIDNMLTLYLFKRQTADVAMVNWSSHPDDTNGKNHMLTAGYPHYLRDALEQGFSRMGMSYPKLADHVMFMEGQVGGQIGPSGQVHALGDDGAEVHKCNQPQNPPTDGCLRNGTRVMVTPDDCTAWPRAIGHSVATFAYKARDNGATTISDVPIAWRTKRFRADVDNVGFQVAFLAGLIDTKQIYNWDKSKPVDMMGNRPQVETEETYVELGPSSFVTIPGELHPELFVGGYDGSRSGTYTIIDPNNPNPPDLSKAPPPPYVCDLMQGQYRFALGLTSDYLGYILPDFNFQLADATMGKTPWVDEAPGDHYEETRSINGYADEELIGTLKKLVWYGHTEPQPTTMQCPGR